MGEVPGQKAYRRRSREGRRTDPHAFHLPLVVIPFHRPGSIHQRGARRKEEQEIHRTTITTRAQCGTWGRCVGCVCTKGVGEKHMRVVGTPTPPPHCHGTVWTPGRTRGEAERTAQKAPTSGASAMIVGAVNCPVGRGRGGAEQI